MEAVARARRTWLPKRESTGVMLSHDDTGLLQIETNLPRADNYPDKLGM